MKSRVEFTVIYIYLFIYVFVSLVCGGNDVTRPPRWWPNGKASDLKSDLRAEDGGSNPARGFFFSIIFFLVGWNPEPFIFIVFLFGLK